MIFVSSITAGGDHLAIRNYQVTGEYYSQARISRTKLLDGGTSIVNSGVAVGDRDLEIECRFTPADAVIIKAMHEDAAQIRISYWDGVYAAEIARLRISRDGVASITFYLTEQLS